MTRYVVEQRQADGRAVRRQVEADGYLWAGGGVVSFTREDVSKDGSRHNTFATLFDCLLVAEDGAIDAFDQEPAE